MLWQQTGEGWVRTDALREGAALATANGLGVRVVFVAETERTAPTFNLEVADFHTYFVGEDGVWVHNTCPHGNPGGKGRCVTCKMERQEHRSSRSEGSRNKHEGGQARKEREMRRAEDRKKKDKE